MKQVIIKDAMNIESIAHKVNKVILAWAKDPKKIVIGIDGYTGIGKTTLVNKLAELNSEVLVVNRDDFQIPRVKFTKLYKGSNQIERIKLFELGSNNGKKLERLVKAFYKNKGAYKIKVYDGVTGKVTTPRSYDLSKKVMVVEGVFLFHPKLLKHLWDKKIYLKGDVKKIDKRRVEREKKRWGKDYFPETHPDSYFRQVIIALQRYQKVYKPEQSADLVVHITH